MLSFLHYIPKKTSRFVMIEHACELQYRQFAFLLEPFDIFEVLYYMYSNLVKTCFPV